MAGMRTTLRPITSVASQSNLSYGDRAARKFHAIESPAGGHNFSMVRCGRNFLFVT
jgi:hypothetical protein